MGWRVVTALLLAGALLGGPAGCSAATSPSSRVVAGQPLEVPKGSTDRAGRTIQSLTLAGLSRSAKAPVVGEALPQSAYAAFLVGHVSLAAPAVSIGQPAGVPTGVAITLDAKGTAALAAWTAAHAGERMVVIFDGRVASAPVIKEPLRSGHLFVSVDSSSAVLGDLLQAAVDSQSGKY